MSSIKATFWSLLFSFHVIFSLFQCPRVVFRRAESGMQGIWLLRKTHKKNKKQKKNVSFFGDISNISWLKLRGSRDISIKSHFQRIFSSNDYRNSCALSLTVVFKRFKSACCRHHRRCRLTKITEPVYGCVFSQVTRLSDNHMQTVKTDRDEPSRHKESFNQAFSDCIHCWKCPNDQPLNR